jgi:hypothetical protein
MSDDGDRKSAATVLVELAEDRYQFRISTDGEPFAVPIMDKPVAKLLRGGKRGLRSELARAYYEEHGKAAPQQALADALLVIEGKAESADPEPLLQRVARTGGYWWIDLGDATGEAIRISPDGWTITTPTRRFRRTVLTAPLSRPTGGTLSELWALLNVAEEDRPLVLAWLVAAMVAGIPHPILDLAGEQGTGKSTAARILTDLIDPSPVPLRKAPRDSDSWVTAASGSWVVAIDNVSTIPDWLSDTLCRAVTGDGDVRRQLYTDAGLAVFAFRRCIILTGIDLGAVRGDLADRLLVIDLDVISEWDRMLDADLASRWANAHPRVLGALLDLAAGVAGVLPSVRLDRSPRMADYAQILAAVDKVLGTDGLQRYLDRASSLAADSLTADPFVVELKRQLTATFVGSAAELLGQIVTVPDERKPKDWPANARQLTTLLKRQAPVMRRAGWTVEEALDPHTKLLRWTVRRPENPGNGSPQPPRSPRRAGVAGVAWDEYESSQDDEAMQL